MQSFKEWLSLRNKIYYESFVFLEQGNLPVILPTPIEYPVGSGKRFWQIDDPDNPGEKIDISTALPNARQIATDLIRRNKQMGRTTTPGATPPGATPPGAPPTEEAEPSFINPQRVNGKNVIVNGQEMPLSSRNVTVKRMIAKRKSRPYASITDDEANIELAYMATEESEKDFMRMDGKQGDLKKIQQQFINRYGITPEEQMARGANKEFTRLTPRKPEDWMGITIQQGKLPSRQPLPQFATKIPYKPAGQPTIAPPNAVKKEENKSILERIYGNQPSKWQKSARVAAGLVDDPSFNDKAFYFMQFLNDYGEDYRKWSKQNQETAGIESIPYVSVKEPDLEQRQEKVRNEMAARKSKYEKEYGQDSNSWQQSARIAAGIERPKNDEYQRMGEAFARNFDENPNWWEWDDRQKIFSGILTSDKPPANKQSEQKNVNSIYQNSKLNKRRKNDLLRQYINSKNGLMNLDDSDIYWLAYGIGDKDNTFNGSFLSPEEANNLLTRSDLKEPTKFYLKQIAGKENQPPVQAPPVQDPPANKQPDQNEERIQAILNEIEKLDEIAKLQKLIEELTGNEYYVNEFYKKNKEAIDKYGSENNIKGINNILIAILDDNVKGKIDKLKEEAEKLLP